MLARFPYGFVPQGAMPSGPAEEGSLSLRPGVRWDTTGMLIGAKNHCAAVMLSNLVQCFEDRGADRLSQVYEQIGNGPVLRAPSRGKNCLRSLWDMNLHVRGWRRYASIPLQIELDRPCAILVAKNIRDWHWVLCIGWRRYENGDLWLEVVNGWQPDPVYYRRNVGSRFIYAASFERRS